MDTKVWVEQLQIMDDAGADDNDDMAVPPDVSICDADFRYKKQVEGGLRCWIQAPDCRQQVANEYFNNPPPEFGLLSIFVLKCVFLLVERLDSTML
jgi:hypothetical protein